MRKSGVRMAFGADARFAAYFNTALNGLSVFPLGYDPRLRHRISAVGVRKERGRSHALRSDIDMPLAVDLLHRGVERLHGRVADHVRGVLHLKNLVRLAEGLGQTVAL